VASGATVVSDPGTCTVESDMSAPPPGMTATQDVTVDTATCEAKPGPVQTVPSDQIPTDPADPDRVTQPLPDALAAGAQTALTAPAAAASACRRWNTYSRGV
jgi:hypothetical protein